MVRVDSSSLLYTAFVCAASLSAGACAQTAGNARDNDPIQEISVDTPGAPGATCTLRSVVIGTQIVKTPAKIRVERSAEHITALCRKECFQDGSGLIEAYPDPAAAKRAASGAGQGSNGETSRYIPENHIRMVPIPGCQPGA